MLDGRILGTVLGGKRKPTRHTFKNGNVSVFFYMDREERNRKSTEELDKRDTLVRVFLPTDSKVFDYLEPGRRVSVEGEVITNPRVANQGNGEDKVYANLGIRNARVQFLDLPPITQSNYAINMMVKAELITAEQAEQYKAHMAGYYAARDEEDPPRTYIDESREEESNA